jgi:acyl carrier protein
MRDEAAAAADEAFRTEIAELIVETLVLEDVRADEIDPQAPLFGDGLGLDSIDALEIAFAIAQRYGFKLRSDDDKNGEIFASLDALARHVAEHRTK